MFTSIAGISTIENHNSLFIKNDSENQPNVSVLNAEDSSLDRAFLQDSCVMNDMDSHSMFLKPFSTVKNENEQSSYLNAPDGLSFIE